MKDPETGNVIVFNGEIYNYRTLRTELSAVGHRFHTRSDTEVLLKLYADSGQEMFKKIRGMYAFGIWDERQHRLLLARDPFGIKPLYLADDGKTLIFASQVKALLASHKIKTSPSPAGHVGFFLWGHVPEPFTLYKEILALPAGASLLVDATGKKVSKQFFKFTSELRGYERKAETVESIQQSLREALLDSVRHHLVSDVPVGVFLSAGLDSTTITALAVEAGESELRTITLGFNEYQDTSDDEVPMAELVAKHYETSHKTCQVTRQDFLAEIDHVLEAMDQPSIDGVNSYFMAKVAHESGLKVALSGLGGDELFGGYSGFQDIPRLIQTLKIFKRLPEVGKTFRWISAPLVSKFISPKYASLFEFGGDWAEAYFLWRGLFMPWELSQVLEPEIIREGWQQLETFSKLHHTIEGLEPERLKITVLEASWYMRNQLLRDIDWASMAHSVEVRVPLLDIELMRTIGCLVYGGYAPTKLDMARCPIKSLPEEVLNRRKSGFSVPVRDWILQKDAGVGGRSSDSKRGLRPWAVKIGKHFSIGIES
jgi:asparagine synthase (glutamine-hydrolysing)